MPKLTPVRAHRLQLEASVRNLGNEYDTVAGLIAEVVQQPDSFGPKATWLVARYRHVLSHLAVTKELIVPLVAYVAAIDVPQKDRSP